MFLTGLTPGWAAVAMKVSNKPSREAPKTTLQFIRSARNLINNCTLLHSASSISVPSLSIINTRNWNKPYQVHQVSGYKLVILYSCYDRIILGCIMCIFSVLLPLPLLRTFWRWEDRPESSRSSSSPADQLHWRVELFYILVTNRQWFIAHLVNRR